MQSLLFLFPSKGQKIFSCQIFTLIRNLNMYLTVGACLYLKKHIWLEFLLILSDSHRQQGPSAEKETQHKERFDSFVYTTEVLNLQF